MECSNPLCSWLALWAKSNGRSQGTCGGQDGGCARHVDVCHQPLHGLHSFRTLATVKLLGCACFGENRYKAARNQWSGIFFLNGKIDDILRINSSTHRYVFLLLFCFFQQRQTTQILLWPWLAAFSLPSSFLLIIWCCCHPSFPLWLICFLFCQHCSRGKSSICVCHQTSVSFPSIPVKRHEKGHKREAISCSATIKYSSLQLAARAVFASPCDHDTLRT